MFSQWLESYDDSVPVGSPVSSIRGKLVCVPGCCTEKAATRFAAAMHCTISVDGLVAMKCASAPINASPAPCVWMENNIVRCCCNYYTGQVDTRLRFSFRKLLKIRFCALFQNQITQKMHILYTASLTQLFEIQKWRTCRQDGLTCNKMGCTNSNFPQLTLDTSIA